MTTANMKPGFYGNDDDTFYVAVDGQAWLVESSDDLAEVRRVGSSVPNNVVSVDSLIMPAEAARHLTQINKAS